MGYADRDYYRETQVRPPSRLAGAPVVKWLLILNIGIFFIDILYNHLLSVWGHFSVATVFQFGQVWRAISFQFLHADFGHLLFNMIGLYFFGSFIEQEWRSRGFLVFYLVCGLAGALFYSLLQVLGVFGTQPVRWGDQVIDGGVFVPLVGASAGIFGILAMAALVAPQMQVRLLIPPVTLTMKQLALILLGIGVVVVLAGWRNAGGEAGHLGGALAGFLLYKVPALRGMLERLSGSGGRPGPRRSAKVREAKILRPKKKRYEKKLRPKSRVSKADAGEVDRILDKINEHGLQSLTDEERELLTKAGGK